MSAAKKSNAALLRTSSSSKTLAMPAAGSGGPGTASQQRPPKAPPPRKASCAAECEHLEQLPNIGPSLAADLREVGIAHPLELAERDPFELYTRLCKLRDKRQDPCVLDTFMAAVEFMRGAPPQHWWAYTAERKQRYGAV